MAEFFLDKFQVEYQTQPLDVETSHPRFSWQLAGDQPGLAQSAYQIRVHEKETLLWDSGKVSSSQTTQIAYLGQPLSPCTDYQVSLTVWDLSGKTASASTRFGTSLMNDSIDAWEGAQWIGPAQCSLYAFTKEVFSVEGELRIPPGSSQGGLLLGGKDPRLLDANKNLFGLAGENYITYELDVSVTPALLRIYRVGYVP